MKRLVMMVLVIVLIPAVAFSYQGRKGKKTGTMSIQLKSIIVRSSPNYMSPKAGLLKYGDQVKVVNKQDGWCQIEAPGGWIPESAVTKATVKIDSDKKYAAGDPKRDEVALAGKGFNPKVEDQYKKDNPELKKAYQKVDQVEKNGATEAELKAFQKAGKLQTR